MTARIVTLCVRVLFGASLTIAMILATVRQAWPYALAFAALGQLYQISNNVDDIKERLK